MSIIKFETINGQLCRMVEPAPLTPDATFPCLVRLIQDDSPMGVYNKYYFDSKILANHFPISISEKHISLPGTTTYTPHYSCFEIIGYPVVEGSKEWALYQMMQGKKVVSGNGTVYWQDKDDNDLIKYADGYGQIWVQMPNLFLKCVGASGWKIHEPEPKESPVDPKERPLRNLILEAKENGKNIRTFYQNLIFTPDALTGLLAKGRFRWWNTCNWELTDKEQNYYPQIKLVKPEPEPEFKVGDWVEHKESKEQATIRRIMNYGAIEIEFAYSTESDIYQTNDFHNDFRKLSSSEVIVHIGCLSGTIAKAYGEEKGTFILSGLSGQRNVLWLSMLDTQTRELVESLLKAQEEENG